MIGAGVSSKMSADNNREPVGLKLRYHPDAVDRAAAAAGELIMPPILEEDRSLQPGTMVLDVSYHNGEIDHGVDYVPFIGSAP
jgi:hypothetical protein